MTDREPESYRLFARWRQGAEIVAGRCLLSREPEPVWVARECSQRGCLTIVVGLTASDADSRLNAHIWREHTSMHGDVTPQQYNAAVTMPGDPE